VTVLLDTNAYAGFKSGEAEVVERIRSSSGVMMSTIVAGELLFGFHHGARFERSLAELKTFLDRPEVSLLSVTLTTADRFGRISAILRRKGRLLPTNDIWVAAHTMESGAELLSFDEHFAAVDGLVWTRLGATP